MRRGDIYLVRRPSASRAPLSTDPKIQRAFVVVSRDSVLRSKSSTVICAPVYTVRHGISAQVEVGTDEELKHDCSIHCDELVSLPKGALSNYIGRLSAKKIRELDQALTIALDLDRSY